MDRAVGAGAEHAGVDLARGSPSEFASAFAGRHAPDRGARIGASHVLYPNERNTVMLARDSSLVGEHHVRGEGVPSSMKFTLGEAQNVMPAIQLQTRGTVQDSMAISWASVPHARAYYLHAMSANGSDRMATSRSPFLSISASLTVRFSCSSSGIFGVRLCRIGISCGSR